ncbi:hypothetical protein GN956_G14140 [Arapaima gigas]
MLPPGTLTGGLCQDRPALGSSGSISRSRDRTLGAVSPGGGAVQRPPPPTAALRHVGNLATSPWRQSTNTLVQSVSTSPSPRSPGVTDSLATAPSLAPPQGQSWHGRTEQPACATPPPIPHPRAPGIRCRKQALTDSLAAKPGPLQMALGPVFLSPQWAPAPCPPTTWGQVSRAPPLKSTALVPRLAPAHLSVGALHFLGCSWLQGGAKPFSE